VKLVSFEHQGRVAAGLWLDHQVLDLAAAARAADESEGKGKGAEFDSMLAIIRGGAPALAAVRRLEGSAAQWPQALLPISALRLLAPIPVPVRNIFCVGRNYLDHINEGYAKAGREAKLPEAPQFFTKATHALNTPDGDVRLDTRLTRLLDYEVELAIVIGRTGRDIAREQAMQYVFGYTIANDFTARDLQRRHDQWFKGKSLDTTCPLGPCIVDRDSIADPSTLELSLSVNGEERQRARVAQMIFDLPSIIASLSAGLTLEAGDIIATGTPAGVGFAMTPSRALADGDLVVARIAGIGELRNRIVAVS
jgi:2-keto-4-pentenoate hydratase/2-oxohepta-3-ene-1,7-dioic acid hydratase in catechol pathway